jgi:transposase-like protein
MTQENSRELEMTQENSRGSGRGDRTPVCRCEQAAYNQVVDMILWGRVGEVAKVFEISDYTYLRWRNQYGGMKADDAKELRRLKDENVRLKRVVADLTLDNAILKEVARDVFSERPQREHASLTKARRRATAGALRRVGGLRGSE